MGARCLPLRKKLPLVPYTVRTAKALARLCGCAGSPELSMVAYVISTLFTGAGLNEKKQMIGYCFAS